ncbi:hypothetical protein SKAU_G00317830 [Synaphobranchus kaupii]|uniref:Uncharacterized protein n=1 Tax=Synaphobranchus kaupii TaxID=118154 RepID=A0A9Q1IJT0_SYNKA|nr:hypothetical protein SKAU_G00317830 [Synaphobranchus kaupii]
MEANGREPSQLGEETEGPVIIYPWHSQRSLCALREALADTSGLEQRSRCVPWDTLFLTRFHLTAVSTPSHVVTGHLEAGGGDSVPGLCDRPMGGPSATGAPVRHARLTPERHVRMSNGVDILNSGVSGPFSADQWPGQQSRPTAGSVPCGAIDCAIDPTAATSIRMSSSSPVPRRDATNYSHAS